MAREVVRTGGALDAVEKGLKALRFAGVVVSAATLFGLVLMITADTMFRYFLLKPFPATVEISQLVEPYVIFVPMAFALAAGSHVRVSVLTSRMSARMTVLCDCLAYGIGIAFFGVMTYVSWLTFWSSFVINETVLAAITLYWWTGKLAMPVGMGLITIECAYQFVRVARGYGSSEGA